MEGEPCTQALLLLLVEETADSVAWEEAHLVVLEDSEAVPSEVAALAADGKFTVRCREESQNPILVEIFFQTKQFASAFFLLEIKTSVSEAGCRQQQSDCSYQYGCRLLL